MSEVAVFLSNLSAGGAHQMAINIWEGLLKKEIDADLLVANPSGKLARNIDNRRFASLDKNRTINSIPELVSYQTKNNPQSILATPVTATVPAILSTKISPTSTTAIPRVPVVLSETTLFQDPNGARERVLTRMVRLTYKRQNKLIAISNGVKTDLVENFNVPEDNISVVYNPTVTEDLLNDREESLSHEFFELDVPVFVSAGRMVTQKNFDLLLRSFQQLVSQIDARLLILGDGKQRERLQDLAMQLGIGDRVSFEGYIPNPMPYFRKSDTFVLSSSWEGFGNVIVEALACGTQVVSTDCPSGPAEILDQGEYGYLVPPGDVDSLSRKMRESLSSEIKKEKLIERAIDFHIDKISTEYAAEMGVQ